MENKLREMLKNLNPLLHPDEYIFVSLNETDEYLKYEPVCFFSEEEGVTLIINRKKADRYGLKYSYVFKMITLSLYSDLNSVGLIAAVSGRLAEAGISVNPVSAFHHDHLFVPSPEAEEVMRILKKMGEDISG